MTVFLKQAYLLPLQNAKAVLSMFRYLIGYCVLLWLAFTYVTPMAFTGDDKTARFYAYYGIAFAIIYALMLFSSGALKWHERVIQKGENISASLWPNKTGFIYMGYVFVILLMYLVIAMAVGLVVQEVAKINNVSNDLILQPTAIIASVALQVFFLKSMFLHLPKTAVDPEGEAGNKAQSSSKLMGTDWFVDQFLVLGPMMLAIFALSTVETSLQKSAVTGFVFFALKSSVLFYGILVFLGLQSLFFKEYN